MVKLKSSNQKKAELEKNQYFFYWPVIVERFLDPKL